MTAIASVTLPAPAIQAPAAPAGDAVLAALYEQLGPRIRVHLLRLTRDPDLADDLLQEAFLRLLAERQAGRAPDNAGAWLYRTSTNLVVSGARRRAVARRFAPALVDARTAPSPEDAVIDAERSAALGAALRSLGDRERLAVVLAAAGETGPQIGGRMGRTPVAVRSMLYRARGRLRHALVDTLLAPPA